MTGPRAPSNAARGSIRRVFPVTPAAIGPYRVLRELGRGGMGVVYEVQDPQAPRTLALKLILPGEAGPDALARFAREAQLLARVRHPNVVTVHTMGEANGAPYLVTDLVVGHELSALGRTGPVDPRRAAELVRTLADAVAALHRLGVLHRDLKPENVFVREDGTPVLLDFGLAREIVGPDAASHSVSGLASSSALGVYALAASPDGRTIAVGGDWRRVWVIDVDRLRPDRHIDAATDELAYVEDPAISSDARSLALVRSHVADESGERPYFRWRIEVWSLEGDQPTLVSGTVDEGSPTRPSAVTWTNDFLVVGHATGLITSWRVKPGADLELAAEARLPGGSDGTLGTSDVHELVTAPDGKTVYVASKERVAALVAGAKKLSWTSALLARPAFSIDVSPDGALLVVGDDAGEVTLWGAPPPR